MKEEQKESCFKTLDDLQSLLIKWSVKVSTEKAWLLNEFPFRFNPGDKPNDAQTWRNNSSLYTEDQFQANSEKKMKWHFIGKKYSPPNISWLQARKLLVWKLYMRKTAAKLAFIILKLNVTFINKSYGDTKRRCVRYLTPDPSSLVLLHFPS